MNDSKQIAVLQDEEPLGLAKTAGAGRYSPEQMIAALKASHGCVHVAATTLQCSPSTVYRFINRDDEVKAALDESRELRLDLAELRLDQAVKNGEAWAICFLLKTLGKSRGYVERREHTGKDGAPLQVDNFDPRSMSFEELRTMRDRLQRLVKSAQD